MLRDILFVGASLAICVGIIIATEIRDDSIKTKKFDCRMLVGSWHPDVPKEVIQECRRRSQT